MKGQIKTFLRCFFDFRKKEKVVIHLYERNEAPTKKHVYSHNSKVDFQVWDIEAVHRMTSKYSHALETLQTCSLVKGCPILHPKVAFEAPCSCAHCGTNSVHDDTLHSVWTQCWRTLLFEFIPVMWYWQVRTDKHILTSTYWQVCTDKHALTSMY